MNRREFMERMISTPLVAFSLQSGRIMITDILGGPEDPLRAILLKKIDREIDENVPEVDRDRLVYSERVVNAESDFGSYTVLEWRIV